MAPHNLRRAQHRTVCEVTHPAAQHRRQWQLPLLLVQHLLRHSSINQSPLVRPGRKTFAKKIKLRCAAIAAAIPPPCQSGRLRPVPAPSAPVPNPTPPPRSHTSGSPSGRPPSPHGQGSNRCKQPSSAEGCPPLLPAHSLTPNNPAHRMMSRSPISHYPALHTSHQNIQHSTHTPSTPYFVTRL